MKFEKNTLNELISYLFSHFAELKEKKCSENETFSECGAGCVRTCADVITGVVRACPAICTSGCQCKEGYAKLDELCVRSEECK